MALTVSASFTATGSGDYLGVKNRDSFTYTVSGTWVGTVILESTKDGGLTFSTVATLTSNATATPVDVNVNDSDRISYRFRCTAYTSGTIVTSLIEADLTLVEYFDANGKSVFKVTEGGPVSGVANSAASYTVTGGTAANATMYLEGAKLKLRNGTSGFQLVCTDGTVAIDVSDAPLVTVGAAGNVQSHVIFGAALTASTAAAAAFTYGRNITDGSTVFSGGGAKIQMYGSTHATKANVLELTGGLQAIASGSYLGASNATGDPGAVVDGIRIGSVDISAGNASLAIRTETAVVTESVVSDRTLLAQINGTTYKFCLKV